MNGLETIGINLSEKLNLAEAYSYRAKVFLKKLILTKLSQTIPKL